MPDAIILENCIRVHAKVSLEGLALMAMISTRDKFPGWLPPLAREQPRPARQRSRCGELMSLISQGLDTNGFLRLDSSPFGAHPPQLRVVEPALVKSLPRVVSISSMQRIIQPGVKVGI